MVILQNASLFGACSCGMAILGIAANFCILSKIDTDLSYFICSSPHHRNRDYNFDPEKAASGSKILALWHTVSLYFLCLILL